MAIAFSKPPRAALHGKYRNPVYPGDFPDPSVIRVGDRLFYAVTTSTNWAPYFPIFRSTDLVTWTLVGHVFAERPAWCAGNFWAPDFAEKNGRFYIYYTARRKEGGLCVAVATADRPEGPYVDHGPLVGQRYGSIDAMAADDERGDRWLLWKEDGNAFDEPTPIWGRRLSADGLVLEGEQVELIRNDAEWEGRLVEAPHVVRRDGWFYMFYSGNRCCGEDCAYAVGVARARTLAGPWEKCPRNPILASNADWRCPGHGAPVEDAAGRFFYLYHAYDVHADGPAVGRQLCLDAIRWDADGWPSINGGFGPSRAADAPFEPQRPQRRAWTANFAEPLDRLWQWPQAHKPSRHVDQGGLVLAVAQSRKTSDPLGAVLARPVVAGDYVAETIVDARAPAEGVLASLCAYGTQRDALGIGIRDGSVVVWRRRGGRFVELGRAKVGAGLLHLRCTAREGHAYRFAFSRDGRNWTTLGGRLDGSWVPPWDAAARIALAVGGAERDAARFTALRVRPADAKVTVLPARPSRRRALASLVTRAVGRALADRSSGY